MDVQIVVIEDTVSFKEHALMYSIEDKYFNLKFCTTPSEGLQFIADNLSKNLIVLLDVDFPPNEKNGHEILEDINKMSKLIPVILWTAINENTETFSDFINNNAYGFISKDSTVEDAMKIIDKAVISLQYNVDNILEDWLIRKEEDKDKPIYITSDGRSYSINQIIYEIRMQSEIGKEFSKRLNSLTIDLLLRKKENLNG